MTASSEAPGDLLDVRLHPTLTVEQAGQVLGLGRSSAYEAARLGRLPTLRLSERRVVVPTAALRLMLGLPAADQ